MHYPKNMVGQITLGQVNWLDKCHVLNLTKVGKEKMQGVEEIVIFQDKKLLLEKNIWNTELSSWKTLAARREIIKHKFYQDLINVALPFIKKCAAEKKNQEIGRINLKTNLSVQFL